MAQQIILPNGTVTEMDLYPRRSFASGKGFNSGYFVDDLYFATGEEKERDEHLSKRGLYDKETPNWDSLVSLYGEFYYWTEWDMEDDIYNSAYDIDGNLYVTNGSNPYKQITK